MRISPGSTVLMAASALLLSWDGIGAEATTKLATRLVGAGFRRPIFATAPPGDSNRLFVVEQQTGQIRILNPGTQTIAPAPFLTVSGISKGDEQGLLGLAFHPQYASNGLFFVNYTTTGGGSAGHTEIARYRVQGDPKSSSLADAASKAIVLAFNQPEPNHNGGWLGFGPDGYLYISTGDGGGGNDQHGNPGNGQSRNTLLAKILRLNVDETATYTIPPGNPFIGIAGQREEIWAFGLRNPWRCSFDRLSGNLWIGDVGQSAREEIDFIPAGVGGRNFGWRAREGTIQNSAYPSETPVTPAVEPVHDYPRGSGVSVVGGYMYHGAAIPALEGVYLFGDYGSARFWSFRSDGTNKLDFLERTAELNPGNPKPIGNISSFGEDAAGELFVCDISDGQIYQIVGDEPAPLLSLAALGITNNVFRLSFGAAVNQQYSLEAMDGWTTNGWRNLTNLTATSTNVLLTDPVGSTQRYYRVKAL
ncbi:MAG: PQQ-dependent sugar dehydrogenase [Verrucomicrobiota bacterium]